MVNSSTVKSYCKNHCSQFTRGLQDNLNTVSLDFSIKQHKSVSYGQLHWMLTENPCMCSDCVWHSDLQYSLCHVCASCCDTDTNSGWHWFSYHVLQTRDKSVCVYECLCVFVCVLWGVWHWHNDALVGNYDNSKQEAVQCRPIAPLTHKSTNNMSSACQWARNQSRDSL